MSQKPAHSPARPIFSQEMGVELHFPYMQMLHSETVRRVLVVDDEPMLRDLCSTLLETWGYSPVEAHDGQDALEQLGRSSVDIVLLDVNMPRLRGDALLARLRQEHPELPVIIMSSEGDNVRSNVMGLGASSFLVKPFRPSQLQDHIRHALP